MNSTKKTKSAVKPIEPRDAARNENAKQDEVRHPNEVLEELLKKSATQVVWQRVEPVTNRLQALNKICAEQYENGELDFSVPSVFKLITKIYEGPVTKGMLYLEPYKTLRNAWTEFSNGRSGSPRLLLTEQRRQYTVAYIDGYFQKHDCFPSRKKIYSEGVTFKGSEDTFLVTKKRHVQFCLEQWEKNWLYGVPQQVVLVCDQLYELSLEVPVPSAVRASLPAVALPISDEELVAGIDRWRRCRFATEVLNFKSTKELSSFSWLLLHADMADWQPIVASYLDSIESINLRKYTQLSLFTFFSDYVLAQRLPLTPRKFLKKGNKLPPFADACPDLSGDDIEKRWQMINRFLEHILDRCEGFIEIDIHGHRSRCRNTITPSQYYLDQRKKS